MKHNPNSGQPQSPEEVLKHERSLKICDDGDQEQAQMKEQFDQLSILDRSPSNGIVIREPESGKNPNLEFPGKSHDNPSHEEVLKYERSLKKPMVYDDQERAKFDWNPSNRRPSNGIVIREPEPGNNQWQDEEIFKVERLLKKPMAYYDDNVQEQADIDARKGKNQYAKSRKPKRKRKLEPLPEDVRKKIEEKAREKGEDKLEVVLVIQKALQMGDVTRQLNRLSIPRAQLENPFLTWDEDQWLGERNVGNYMTVPIIEPSGGVPSVNLRRWNVGKRGVAYVLNGGDWFEVVRLNQLREGMTVQLWAFWIRGDLNFALVVLSDEDEDEDEDEVGMEIDVQGAEGEVENGTSKPEDISEP